MAWYARFAHLTAKLLTVVPLLWEDEAFLRIEREARRRHAEEWRVYVDAMISFAMAGHLRLGVNALAHSMDRAVMDIILRAVYDSFFKDHPHFLRRGLKMLIDTSPVLAWAEKKPAFEWMRDDLLALAPYTRL